jgi:Uma2 family endonuclease
VPLVNLGSATFKTESHAFEADKTYYLNAKKRLRDRKRIDLAIDPPPDLLVEIDITTDSSDKLTTTYSQFRVPEVWRYDLSGFAAFALSDAGGYAPIEVSRIIRGLPISEIASRIERSDQAQDDIVAFAREWLQWLRDHGDLHVNAI